MGNLLGEFLVDVGGGPKNPWTFYELRENSEYIRSIMESYCQNYYPSVFCPLGREYIRKNGARYEVNVEKGLYYLKNMLEKKNIKIYSDVCYWISWRIEIKWLEYQKWLEFCKIEKSIDALKNECKIINLNERG